MHHDLEAHGLNDADYIDNTDYNDNADYNDNTDYNNDTDYYDDTDYSGISYRHHYNSYKYKSSEGPCNKSDFVDT